MTARDLHPADMTPDQAECYRLICDLAGGEHHVIGTVRADGKGLRWNARAITLTTFDWNDLTRLVVLAHDRCIRIDIRPAGSALGITLHRRHQRDGEWHLRHPTLEDHVADIRKHLPAPDPNATRETTPDRARLTETKWIKYDPANPPHVGPKGLITLMHFNQRPHDVLMRVLNYPNGLDYTVRYYLEEPPLPEEITPETTPCP